MIHYPGFANLTRERQVAATDADLAEWTAAAKAADAANAADHAARETAYQAITALASKVWEGEDLQRAQTWLKKNRPQGGHARWQSRIADIRREVTEHRRKTTAEADRERGAAENIAKMARAVLWLKERGKELGKDYEATNAVKAADEIALNEEIERRCKAETWHDFDGQNCIDPCVGWDGEQRRCQCGNRRVSWVRGYEHSFESPSVHAEAY